MSGSTAEQFIYCTAETLVVSVMTHNWAPCANSTTKSNHTIVPFPTQVLLQQNPHMSVPQPLLTAGEPKLPELCTYQLDLEHHSSNHR